MSELYDILVETPPTKVILLALDQGLWDCERSLNELAALCEANHMEAVASVTQKRQTPETGIVLGSGKLEEAAAAAGELGAECAVFDGELTGSQIRNISTALGGMEVIDRTMLILEIFRSRAVTNEGKLQTELALLRYRLPRLQGMGESLSRQGGGGGGGGGARRGAGETKLELDRRHVHARIDALAEKLAEMEKRRGESRKARAKTGMPVVSLVGYTNVGKSSLMNALCGPSVAEADMLFATLDPTSRKLVLPSGMAVLLVDTVGFVSRLPHNLVEAFKSTLEEAAWSDVIVRVADAGDDQRDEKNKSNRSKHDRTNDVKGQMHDSRTLGRAGSAHTGKHGSHTGTNILAQCNIDSRICGYNAVHGQSLQDTNGSRGTLQKRGNQRTDDHAQKRITS